jgi:hypothetical protein
MLEFGTSEKPETLAQVYESLVQQRAPLRSPDQRSHIPGTPVAEQTTFATDLASHTFGDRVQFSI